MTHRQCKASWTGLRILAAIGIVALVASIVCITACYKPTFVFQVLGKYYGDDTPVATSQPVAFADLLEFSLNPRVPDPWTKPK